MTETKFRAEMRRAETMRQAADPDRSKYWAEYIRGLRRAFHGEKFGTEEEHELYKRNSQGYRDALAYDDISSKVGQPSKGGVCIDKITVRPELKAAFEAKAKAEKLSNPDAHRKALSIYAYGINADIDDE